MGCKGNIKGNRRSWKKLSIGGALVLVLAATLLYSLLSFSSSSASAANGDPKEVSGHVYEIDASHPVEGATVVLEIWDGGTFRSACDPVLTDEDGFYFCVIGSVYGNYWEVGDTLKVTATYDTLEASESVIADAGPAQIVDVYFTEAIPEFSSTFVVMISLIVMFAIMYARKRSNGPGHND